MDNLRGSREGEEKDERDEQHIENGEKSVLNKCLPQHIKLNIYLYLKRAKTGKKAEPDQLVRLIHVYIRAGFISSTHVFGLVQSFAYGDSGKEGEKRNATEVRSHKIMCGNKRRNEEN